MRYQHQPGKGPRSNAYSDSRFTHWTEFHPWDGAVKRAFWTYCASARYQDRRLHVQVSDPHPDFVRPVNENDIRAALATVPADYTADLRAVFVLSGSKKQARVARRLFCWGTYWRRCIFLAPFPKSLMEASYRPELCPSKLIEWERAGAVIRDVPGGVRVTFDAASLRRFYLREVLMHEVGHHVDRRPREPSRTREGFANWFALEYGYRLRPNTSQMGGPDLPPWSLNPWR
jgi:hypothetical protein